MKKKKIDWEKRLRVLGLVLTNALVALLIVGSYALYPTLRSILNHGSEGSLALTDTLRNTAVITESAKPIPGKIADTADQIQQTLAAVRPVLTTANAVVGHADWGVQAFNRSARTLEDVVAEVKDTTIPQVNGVLSNAASAVSRVGPAVDAYGALAKDAKESWDDLYYDVSAGVQSGTVAAAGIGRAADAIAHEAPETSKSVREFVGHVGHISQTLDDAITRYFRPSPLRDRILRLLPFIGEGILIGKEAAR